MVLVAETCGIVPDRGLNPCPLSWQANFYPVYHQGNPQLLIFKEGGNGVQITEFLKGLNGLMCIDSILKRQPAI